jgi:hypothetical protein
MIGKREEMIEASELKGTSLYDILNRDKRAKKYDEIRDKINDIQWAYTKLNEYSDVLDVMLCPVCKGQCPSEFDKMFISSHNHRGHKEGCWIKDLIEGKLD